MEISCLLYTPQTRKYQRYVHSVCAVRGHPRSLANASITISLNKLEYSNHFINKSGMRYTYVPNIIHVTNISEKWVSFDYNGVSDTGGIIAQVRRFLQEVKERKFLLIYLL